MSALCGFQVFRFSSGAARGLGSHFITSCHNVATQDPNENGNMTRCGVHSKARADKKKAKKETEYAMFLEQIEKMKQKKNDTR